MRIADEQYEVFNRALETLLSDGRVVQGRGQTISLPPLSRQVIGTYKANPRGFGFIVPLSPDGRQKDLLVPESRALNAVTGDTVLARVARAGKRSGKMVYRARVMEVLERGRTRFVGQLRRQGGEWFLKPDDDAGGHLIRIADAGAAGARAGDQVVAEIVTWPRGEALAGGVITEVLGPRDKPGVDVLSVIRSYDLPDSFGPEVLAEARRVVREFDFDAAVRGREDLRHLAVVTIDPDDARDFDDAVSVEMTDEGLFELGVHIADVAHFVAEGSRLDAEARLRGNSVYFPGRVLPMLPEVLSNGLCSLQESEPRLTKSVFVRFDDRGVVRSVRPTNSVVSSARRLTYKQAQLILDGKTGGFDRPVVELLQRAEALACLIRDRRLATGMLVLDLPEVELVLDKQGAVVDVHPADDSFAHTIIEMFMVEANEAIARLMHERDVPVLRRVHPETDEEALAGLGKYLRLLGHDVPERPGRLDLQRLLNRVHGGPHAFTVNLAVLRALEKACYSPERIGHFALAAEHYLHFTSPIRRYPDLVVHRQLDRCLRGKGRSGRGPADSSERRAAAELGRHCSVAERRAEEAEREVKKMKILELLGARLGGEVRGLVTGVARFGVFVQIERFLVEGLIRVEDLPAEVWLLDEPGGCLVGEISGMRIALGDRITVRIAKVDVLGRRLDLAYVSHRPGRRLASARPEPSGRTAKSGSRKSQAGRHRARRRPRAEKGVTRSKRRTR
jgi:ribonuclease R